MPVISIENEYNNQLKLTQNEKRWQVTSMTGLNSPPAAISSSVVPTFDGERFNSARLEARNIVITLAINGNAETNRMALNKVILPKRYIKIYYRNNSLNLYIEGYVESFEYDVYADNKIIAQASIICPDPYWKDTEQTGAQLMPVVNLFEFPFSLPEEGIALSELLTITGASITNQGTIQAGLNITIEAGNEVLNPYIINATTGEKMLLHTEMTKGDVITINTTRGNKYIRMYKDGATQNIINDMDENSQWISLAIGENSFTYGAEYGAENITVRIEYRNQYGGV